MTTVIVTGSKGKLGSVVVEELAAAGLRRAWPRQSARSRRRTTTPASTSPTTARPSTRCSACRTATARSTPWCTSRPSPPPGQVTDVATFHNNMPATFNVFQGAKRAGIKKIVYASSETVLGLPFEIDPPYIPVDEEVSRPESNYSLVKHLEETMAAQFCRWDPELSIIALRFSNVMYPVEYAGFPAFDADATARRWNLWGYIDARDGAQAVIKGLEYARARLRLTL